MKAVPVSQKKSIQQENIKKLQRLPGSSSNSASGTDLTFGGQPAPKLEATYEPMIIKEARYIAITMMKVDFLSSFVLLNSECYTCFTSFTIFSSRHMKITHLRNFALLHPHQRGAETSWIYKF